MITVLATVDGSETSTSVIPLLIRLAPDMSMTVRLFSVTSPRSGTPWPTSQIPFVAAWSGGPGTGPMIVRVSQRSRTAWIESNAQALQGAKDETLGLLAETAIPLREAGIEVVTDVDIDEDAAQAIIAYAAREKVDLIAMATSGWSGWKDRLQGSVAATVLGSGVAPVLLVRPETT